MGAPGFPGPLLEAFGPLADLWRRVYKTAADVAEARTQAIVAEHVYRQHGRRGVSVVLANAGAVLLPGVVCDLELPWAYVVEGWALYADQPGGLELDLLVCTGYAAYPDFVSICAGAPPLLDALDPTDKARADDVYDWAVTQPRGRVLRVAVVSAEVVTRATLTLFLRAA